MCQSQLHGHYTLEEVPLLVFEDKSRMYGTFKISVLTARGDVNTLSTSPKPCSRDGSNRSWNSLHLPESTTVRFKLFIVGNE